MTADLTKMAETRSQNSKYTSGNLKQLSDSDDAKDCNFIEIDRFISFGKVILNGPEDPDSEEERVFSSQASILVDQMDASLQ